MFDLFRRAHSNLPSPALARALEADGLPPSVSSAQLAVVDERGEYAGRTVKYFRVFDPRRSTDAGVSVRSFVDLDRFPELILRSGHTEQNGVVVLSKLSAPPPPTARRQADRDAHGDDQQIIFPGQRP